MKILTNILLICNTVRYNAIQKLPCKFGESKWNPYRLIALTSSTGTNYVLNEHEYVDQYGSFAIPSEIIPNQIYRESLMNQNEILIEIELSS